MRYRVYSMNDCSAPTELRSLALACLLQRDPASKAHAARKLATRTELAIDTHAMLPMPSALDLPGRPERPVLVAPRAVPLRSPHTAEGRAALLHSIAHIEFNAINLALDAIWRFSDMPQAFYTDWLLVAGEEAQHFCLLRSHLQSLGFDYGDFAGHNGLWEMADKTAHDVLARMALVPRLLEARGLDASPIVRRKFEAAGDARACEILDIILRDEVGHVAIGNRWYRFCCERAGLALVSTFEQLLEQYGAPPPKPPFNIDARRKAGFDEAELSWLES
jgi:uncharacterized ferritin-like protein (DUF455 family)